VIAARHQKGGEGIMADIEGTNVNDNLTGTGDADRIDGFEGHDNLYGGDGDDLLYGGDGNDLLDGQAGADAMDGGDGNDTYYVDDSGDTIAETEADADTDIVQVSASYFDLGTAFVEQVYYIETGSVTLLGSAGGNLLSAGTGNDWLEGKGGNDALFGGGGDDHLDGGDGNDDLDGWLGDDMMFGGAGDDVFTVDSSSDFPVEYADEGIDTVRVKVSSYTLSTNFENADLHYYSGSAQVYGNSAANLFILGPGEYYVSGGAGSDTVSYAHGGAVTADLATGETDWAALNDILISIENLTGSDQADVLRGNGSTNVIDGGPGADTMVGRAGSDIYYVDDAGDVVTELGGGGSDEIRVRLLTSFTLPANVEKLTNTHNYLFYGTGNGLANVLNGGTTVDYLYGGAGHDTLNGGAGDDLLYGEGDHDVLNGGPGSDYLAGGLGNDTYLLGDALDTVSELGGEGTDLVSTALAAYTLTSHVDNLTYSGSGDFHGVGNGIMNTLTGQNGHDTLEGMGGADTLYGGAGDDLLDGGDGDDLLLGGSGTDVLASGDGGDMYRFADGDTGTGAQADRIADFAWWYDKIDLRGIDADLGTAGDQAFAFIGTSAFSGVAGQLRYAFDGTDTWLQGDRDGDGAADVEIVFTGNVALVSTDFYL
jgi:Ca2+-binding RTX toxin-like protein